MSNDERHLDAWLAEVAEADRRLTPPPDLEARVMTRAEIRTPLDHAWAGRTRLVMWTGLGAAIAACVLLSLGLPSPWSQSAPIASAPVVVETATSPSVAALPQIVAEPPVEATLPVPPVVAAKRATRRAARPPVEREVLDFVPLVPMSDEELQGAFQIVRVQLSRGPDGPVQADVLLGEDGMARAIRVSSR